MMPGRVSDNAAGVDNITIISGNQSEFSGVTLVNTVGDDARRWLKCFSGGPYIFWKVFWQSDSAFVEMIGIKDNGSPLLIEKKRVRAAFKRWLSSLIECLEYQLLWNRILLEPELSETCTK